MESPRASKGKSSKREEFVSLDGMLTVDDLAALPDTKPRYELINGILVQKMTTKRKHSNTAGYLLVELVIWSRTQGIGWQFFPEGTGVRVHSYKAYVPDVVGFASGAVLDPEESIGGAPFLVAEVLSKSTARRDRIDKLRDYASIGVQLYLIADPDNEILEVYVLENGKYGAPQVLESGGVWQPAELAGLELEVEKFSG
jgi:Uma2 family endonuclease